MKEDPSELWNLHEDLRGVIHRHPAVIRVYPEIATHIIQARDKAVAEWRKVTERDPVTQVSVEIDRTE